VSARTPHRIQMSDSDRLAKNARIKVTSLATRQRRKDMVVRVRQVKITDNKLTARQRDNLRRLFLEAKWVRNSALAAQRFDRAYIAELGGAVDVRMHDGTYETRQFEVLGGQMMQAVIDELRDNLRGLAAAKGAGRKVGKLRFSREVTSVNLMQFDRTHKIDRARDKIKVANVHGWLHARGLEQLDDVDEIANAKIVQRPNGYFLLLTTYTHPRPNVGRATQTYQPETAVGIDMGVATHVTLSDGRKFNALFEETERLKRLRRKLSRQQKGSANYCKTKRLIRQESDRITRRKDDYANKFVHELLRNEHIYFQDENISSWKVRSGYIRGGRRIQHSVLGRVKSALVAHERAVMLPKRAATTATCVCGTVTKHAVSERTFACPVCGYSADRDVHAAVNMIRLGSTNLTRPGRTGTPVEIGVRPAADMNFAFMSTTGSQSMKQEAATSSGSP